MLSCLWKRHCYIYFTDCKPMLDRPFICFCNELSLMSTATFHILGSTTIRKGTKYIHDLMCPQLLEELWWPGHHGLIDTLIQAKHKFSFEIQHLPISGLLLFMLLWTSLLYNIHIYQFLSRLLSLYRGGQWNSGGHCTEAAWPLNGTLGMNYPEKNKIVEEVILQMKTPVTLLNVTGLSAYRIDGHPSIYGKKPRNRYSSNIQDCSHWCLPGVPDTWNEILHFHLQSKQKHKSHSRFGLWYSACIFSQFFQLVVLLDSMQQM